MGKQASARRRRRLSTATRSRRRGGGATTAVRGQPRLRRVNRLFASASVKLLQTAHQLRRRTARVGARLRGRRCRSRRQGQGRCRRPWGRASARRDIMHSACATTTRCRVGAGRSAQPRVQHEARAVQPRQLCEGRGEAHQLLQGLACHGSGLQRVAEHSHQQRACAFRPNARLQRRPPESGGAALCWGKNILTPPARGARGTKGRWASGMRVPQLSLAPFRACASDCSAFRSPVCAAREMTRT